MQQSQKELPFLEQKLIQKKEVLEKEPLFTFIALSILLLKISYRSQF